MTDRRVPKQRGAEKKTYVCDDCGREKVAYAPPKCPVNEHGRMQEKRNGA